MEKTKVVEAVTRSPLAGTCGDCVHGERDAHLVNCHFFPAQIVGGVVITPGGAPAIVSETRWPQFLPTGWCGQHKSQPLRAN